MKSRPAPIVLFVYNRPWHTRQTVEALQKNELAQASELFIYSDASKDIEDQASVQKVRKYLQAIDGFKKVTIIERDKNWGLADSIIDGVTDIVNRYGKIIVLEDDLVSSPYFLKFMNEALEFYKDEKKVWHISGWNYPIALDGLDDVFLWRVMNCWGWATWIDRWSHYEKNIEKVMMDFSLEDIERFNIDGHMDLWSQVVANKEGKMNTWAIFWYATIFKKNGLCLNPVKKFVENIGIDGSGSNCDTEDIYRSELSGKRDIQFETEIIESTLFLRRIKQFLQAQQKSYLVRIVNKLSRLFMGKNIIR